MKQLLVRAWRERWTDTQWSIHSKAFVSDHSDATILSGVVLKCVFLGVSYDLYQWLIVCVKIANICMKQQRAHFEVICCTLLIEESFLYQNMHFRFTVISSNGWIEWKPPDNVLLQARHQHPGSIQAYAMNSCSIFKSISILCTRSF